MPDSFNNFDFASGKLLLIDKPLDWTSFDVVKKVRGIIRAKVGHAGTLDPLATGLIILCTGKFTKKLQELQNEEKEYTGTFYLGATRPSYDRETEIDQEFDIAHITEELIHQTAQEFTGTIAQVPPVYSAIKKDGKAAYKSARKGEAIELEPRNITIHRFDIERIELPFVTFRVHCTKGTYIRSLAHDFGKALKSGAYLHDLRRTKSGNFSIDDAWNLNELSAHLIENKALILQHAGTKGAGSTT